MVTRTLRHLLSLPGAVARAFPAHAFRNIEQAVRESEKLHDGEIRFAVEAALHPAQLWRGLTARQRAIEVFSQLGLWDTERNNGVLLYLLLADRDVEIVADRGFNDKVGAEEWEGVCRRMEAELREGRHTDAVIAGIENLSRVVARHFPPAAGARNELPDKPVTV
jgi:uncharacterized membrane protein